MKNEDRIVELLAEMVFKQDQLVEEIKLVKSEIGAVKSEVGGVKSEVSGVKSEVSGVKSEVSGVKSEIVKLNLQTAENTRAILKLADKVDTIADLENRVTKIERVVFK
ncbi:MAG: hypothetical protein AABY93_06190 [Bacteroidota bacterium]